MSFYPLDQSADRGDFVLAATQKIFPCNFMRRAAYIYAECGTEILQGEAAWNRQ